MKSPVFGTYLVVVLPALSIFSANCLAPIWVDKKLLHWLMVLCGCAQVAMVLVFLPLLLFKRARAIAGIGIAACTLPFALWIWTLCLVASCEGFGEFVTFFQTLLILPVIPSGLWVACERGEWEKLAFLFVGWVLVFAFAALGGSIYEACKNQTPTAE